MGVVPGAGGGTGCLRLCPRAGADDLSQFSRAWGRPRSGGAAGRAARSVGGSDAVRLGPLAAPVLPVHAGPCCTDPARRRLLGRRSTPRARRLRGRVRRRRGYERGRHVRGNESCRRRVRRSPVHLPEQRVGHLQAGRRADDHVCRRAGARVRDHVLVDPRPRSRGRVRRVCAGRPSRSHHQVAVPDRGTGQPDGGPFHL